VPEPINDTYTGNYKVSQYAHNGRNLPLEIINFSNSASHINGYVYYTFDYHGAVPPKDKVWFYGKSDERPDPETSIGIGDDFFIAGFF
jgi:hypothetical protein